MTWAEGRNASLADAECPAGCRVPSPNTLLQRCEVLKVLESVDFGKNVNPLAVPMSTRGSAPKLNDYPLGYAKGHESHDSTRCNARGRETGQEPWRVVLKLHLGDDPGEGTLRGHSNFNGFDEATPGTALFEPTDADYLPLRGLAAVRQPGPEIIVWKLGGSATDGE